ncbi:hypothetical protein L6164_018162 [Bauhinia variegata]|uniref:Uncharacterized protein n=1 Tax=Bauhinia variegata TaxID=167791 RepID=A0ACB9NCA5_BAUVA|nr:hypothetical protein L6164_018162 [Bauhinia variegata]
MLGPVVSGPKHQIFFARSLSQPNSSAKIFERTLGSSLGPIRPSSMASARPSSVGLASMYSRLCLLGDLLITVRQDLSRTVSRKETTGSDFMISAPPMKSSCKSFKQISR